MSHLGGTFQFFCLFTVVEMQIFLSLLVNLTLDSAAEQC